MIDRLHEMFPEAPIQEIEKLRRVFTEKETISKLEKKYPKKNIEENIQPEEEEEMYTNLEMDDCGCEEDYSAGILNDSEITDKYLPDLHNYSLEQARSFIIQAINYYQNNNKGCLRIILGKGLHSVKGIPRLRMEALRIAKDIYGIKAEVDKKNAGIVNIYTDVRCEEASNEEEP
jgi:hypothetical protein